jgi:hypothetical protein
MAQVLRRSFVSDVIPNMRLIALCNPVYVKAIRAVFEPAIAMCEVSKNVLVFES